MGLWGRAVRLCRGQGRTNLSRRAWGRVARFRGGWLCLTLLFALPRMASAYSLLTHEQVVDIAWKDQIVPLLVGRFPGASQQDLHQAHAYAYGGCLVQDLAHLAADSSAI